MSYLALRARAFSLPTIVLNSSTDSDFITVTRTKALLELKKGNISEKHLKLPIHNDTVYSSSTNIRKANGSPRRFKKPSGDYLRN